MMVGQTDIIMATTNNVLFGVNYVELAGKSKIINYRKFSLYSNIFWETLAGLSKSVKVC